MLPSSTAHCRLAPPFPRRLLPSASEPLRRRPLILLRRSSSYPDRRRLLVRAIDAAQPYDLEASLALRHLRSNSLKIAVIGFGNFAQFLAKTFVAHGHDVLAHSMQSDRSSAAAYLGVQYFPDPNDLFEQHPDVVLLSTSILSTPQVLSVLPLHRLRRSTLFVDVLSVKEFPKHLMLKYLPREFDILCTHPMFGPESGKDSWVGLNFMYDKVRLWEEDERIERCEKFLNIFSAEGCRMVEMSCADHDKYAAGSQFITHTVGRVLEKFGLEESPIGTKGYEKLIDLVENTKGDSFELYYGLFLYNKNAMEQLERLDLAFESVKKALFGRLHEIYREQLLEDAGDGIRRTMHRAEQNRRREVAQKLLHNGGQTPPNLSSETKAW
ncbi:hypothetical protein MLD38_005292 [Melastoma candidum]|uniref:Uncharacterized protein n=1 Tax=Melastoma candidum TaxID=119954 RepID=A0ACB9S8I4_9MYRT|nr:hypothetical protein MLD38_005292 [Melastoma candidum]